MENDFLDGEILMISPRHKQQFINANRKRLGLVDLGIPEYKNNISLRDGVLDIEMKGVISPDENTNGFISLKEIEKAMMLAENSEEVKCVVLTITSPGGACSYTPAFAEFVKEFKKPTIAYIDYLCASAGYWIASSCDMIVARDDSAEIGSVGVICEIQDDTEFNFLNTKLVRIISKISPIKRINKDNKEEYISSLQSEIDEMGEMFISVVSLNRNVDKSYAKENFGRGGTMPAKKAIEVNMIDAIMKKEDFLNFFIKN